MKREIHDTKVFTDKSASEQAFRQAANFLKETEPKGFHGIARVAILIDHKIVGYEVKEEVYIK